MIKNSLGLALGALALAAVAAAGTAAVSTAAGATTDSSRTITLAEDSQWGTPTPRANAEDDSQWG